MCKYVPRKTKSRGCGQVTCHQGARDPQLERNSLFGSYFLLFDLFGVSICEDNEIKHSFKGGFGFRFIPSFNN